MYLGTFIPSAEAKLLNCSATNTLRYYKIKTLKSLLTINAHGPTIAQVLFAQSVIVDVKKQFL